MVNNELQQIVAKIFQQNITITNKQFTRNQSHFSEAEDYLSRNPQGFKNNPRKTSVLLKQIFLNLIHEKTTTTIKTTFSFKTKFSITQWNFPTTNPMNTQNYQPNQMQNEISLSYYLPQHEVTNFSQKPNAAESLQMTMKQYLMGGSSTSLTKQQILTIQ